MIGQFAHQAAAFGDRDEAVGRNITECRMLPTGQRLEAGDAVLLQIDQRLIVWADIAFDDGACKVALDQVALLRARVHVGVEKVRSGGGLLVLGAIERDVGAPQQLDIARRVLRKKRDADAYADMMLQRSGGDRLVELLDHAQRDIGGVLGARNFARQDREFVAAKARHQVLLARGAAQAHGDVDQNLVADAVAVKIVDPLEGVEIEEEYRMRAMAVRRRAHRILEFLIEAAAVGQAGERVLHRQLARVLFRFDAARDFTALQQHKAPRQRQEPEAKQRRQRQRLVGFDHILLRRYPGRIGKDVVFVGDQHGDHHDRQQQEAFPNRRSIAPQCARGDGWQFHKNLLEAACTEIVRRLHRETR
jgi:hypothetical protein